MTPVNNTTPSANAARIDYRVNQASASAPTVQSVVMGLSGHGGILKGIPFAPHLAPANSSARQGEPQFISNTGNPPPPFNPDSAVAREWIDSPAGLRWFSSQQGNSKPR